MRREGRIAVRKADLSQWDREVSLAKEVYNSAWERNWDYIPITDAEVNYMAAGLRKIVDADLVFIAEDEGKAVGVTVALPDVNETLLRVYPKPGGFWRYAYDGLRFLWAKRKRPRLFRQFMMGVVESHRNRGIDACFYVETARSALAKGYRQCEMSLILESNVMMNRITQRLGGQLYKTYRIYDRRLGPAQ